MYPDINNIVRNFSEGGKKCGILMQNLLKYDYLRETTPNDMNVHGHVYARLLTLLLHKRVYNFWHRMCRGVQYCE